MTDDELRARELREDALADSWARDRDPRPLPKVRDFDPRECSDQNETLVSDARQEKGGDLLIEETLWFDDVDSDADESSTYNLWPQERNVRRILQREADAACALYVSLRDFLLAYFEADTVERLQGVVTRGFSLLAQFRARDLCDVVSAIISDGLRRLGCSDRKRIESVRAALGPKGSNVFVRLKRGENLIKEMARKAIQTDPFKPQDRATAKPKRILQDLVAATEGTAFEGKAARLAIATLTPAQQEIFVRALERLAVTGEIEVVAKSDRKTRIPMLPHSYNLPLDLLGRNDDMHRRILAKLRNDEARKARIADWTAERIDCLTGAVSPERQAARDAYDAFQCKDMVESFLKLNVEEKAQ